MRFALDVTQQCHIAHVLTGISFIGPASTSCAVFRNFPNSGWDKLSMEYRSSPYFVIDNDVIGMSSASNDVVDSSNNNNTEVVDVDLECVNTENMQAAEADRPASDVSYLSGECREVLQSISQLTYLSCDTGHLTHCLMKLNELNTWFFGTLPNDSGILLQRESTSGTMGQKQRGRRSKSTI